MRQRKIKNQEEKLAAFDYLAVKELEKNKGKWRELFGNTAPIFVEVGCGKGQFITTLAKQNPQCNYLAIEGADSVVLRAFEKAAQEEVGNVRFITQYIRDLRDFFEEGEIAGIYLNFSDPWPKDRHAKRRLTHSHFLESYFHVLKKDGLLEFKTDNDDLFVFSVEEFMNSPFTVLEQHDDLHRSDLPARLVMTEYESRFCKLGKNIHYLQAQAKK